MKNIKLFEDFDINESLATNNIRFTEDDFNKLAGEDEFEATSTSHNSTRIWAIRPMGATKPYAVYYPNKESLVIRGQKNKFHPILKWLADNSYLSSDDVVKYNL